MVGYLTMPRTVAVIMLLLAFSSLVGFFALGYRMKSMGYPDSDRMYWFANAVFLRSHGLWMIPISVLWGWGACTVERRCGDENWYYLMVAIGVALALFVPFEFVWAAVEPGYLPMLRFAPN